MVTDVVQEDREAVAERKGEVFLRGINYLDRDQTPRSLGFRSDISQFLDNATDDTGYFKLGMNVDEEGHIQEVFYSASSNPLSAVQIPIPWRTYVEIGRPEKLEARCNYFVSEQ
jgi:hypothetical protein